MIYKVADKIFVGNQDDFYDQLNCELFTNDDCVILAGNVFHKKFARIAGSDKDGYDGDMPDEEVESDGCYRDKPCDMLVLNLIDDDSEEHIPHELVELAIRFACYEIVCENKNVVIFDTEASSAAPAIAMIVMARLSSETERNEPDLTYSEATSDFMRRYPKYNPKTGIAEIAKRSYQKIIEREL